MKYAENRTDISTLDLKPKTDVVFRSLNRMVRTSKTRGKIWVRIATLTPYPHMDFVL
jgi:hypothetical protein